MEIQQPYLLFLGDARDTLAAKTAGGVAYWRPGVSVGQLRLPGCVVDLDLPDMTIAEGVAAGAKTLVIGVAVSGGAIPDEWSGLFRDALDAGLDIANGLHRRLVDLPGLTEAAAASGRRLIELRDPGTIAHVGSGLPRTGKRLLTVGTDASVGKMYTSLAIERELAARGVKCSFRATGQTGILIAGEGVPVDAVVSDFISGSIEEICPPNDADHWDVVEGQGSLFHPSFAGVSLGLLHGAQADALVMCHEPTRTHMRALPHQPLPSISDCIDANLSAARLTNDRVELVGFSINSSALSPGEGETFRKSIEDQFGLPAVDPVQTGVAPIVDRLVG